MATDITFTDITNATTLEDGTGYFDKLMKVITLHVEAQYSSGRITGEGYASVYLGGMQSALQQAQQFVLAEKLQEAQIEGALQDNLIKQQQVLIAQKDLELKAKALEIETYRLLNTIPAELALLQKQVDVAERDVTVKEAQSAQDLLVKQEQVIKIQEEVDLLQTQDSEIQLNGAADRLIKAQQTLNEADKRLSTEKARAVQEAQRRLYERQILGFDDNKNIKAFESQLNAWALLYSSGMIDGATPATVIQDANLTSSYNNLVADTDESLL